MERILLCIGVSFAVSYLASRAYIPRARAAGMVGRDMNKEGAPEVAEMGGVAVVAGFLAAFLIVAFQFRDSSTVAARDLLASLATILIVAIVGMVDDVLDLPQRVKAVLPVMASLPLVAVKAGEHAMALPFLGSVHLGDVYPFVLVPLGVTGAANAFNMLAGVNGLEAGMGIVSCATMLVCAAIAGRTAAALLMACMVGALAAFWLFNRYPARLFPGDVGTLTIGASIAAAAIIGNMERVGLFVVLVYLAELALKARSWFAAQSFGVITKEGLVPPERLGSLTHVVMRHTPDERRVAYTLVAVQALVCSLAVLDVWLAYGA